MPASNYLHTYTSTITIETKLMSFSHTLRTKLFGVNTPDSMPRKKKFVFRNYSVEPIESYDKLQMIIPKVAYVYSSTWRYRTNRREKRMKIFFLREVSEIIWGGEELFFYLSSLLTQHVYVRRHPRGVCEYLQFYLTTWNILILITIYYAHVSHKNVTTANNPQICVHFHLTFLSLISHCDIPYGS